MAKHREAYRRGAEVYDRYVNSGGEFHVDDVKLALRRELAEFQDEAYAALVERVFETIDRKREQSEESGQRTMFDTDGVYRLGDGRRIGKASAMVEHAKEALVIDDRNKQAVIRSNERKRQELAALAPFWMKGMTKREAIEAYMDAQSGAA